MPVRSVRHLPFINTKACTRQCPLRCSLQWLESSFSPKAQGAHISRPQLTSPACNSVTPVREGPGAVEISGGCYSCYRPHGQLQAPDSYWIATVLLSDILSYEISLNNSYHLQFSFVFQWRLFLIQSNNVLLVKIDGPVWYTIYHHLPVVKGVK